MMTQYGRALVAIIFGACLTSIRAFVPTPSPRARYSTLASNQYDLAKSTTSAGASARRAAAGALSMGWGDALGKAFANEDMGANKATNPGLKNDLKWCMVTVNGKTVKAVQGQRLRDAVRAAGAKIEYGCEKGDCGTCESIVDGKKIRVCKAIVPRNKDKINVKTKFG